MIDCSSVWPWVVGSWLGDWAVSPRGDDWWSTSSAAVVSWVGTVPAAGDL